MNLGVGFSSVSFGFSVTVVCVLKPRLEASVPVTLVSDAVFRSGSLLSLVVLTSDSEAKRFVSATTNKVKSMIFTLPSFGKEGGRHLGLSGFIL